MDIVIAAEKPGIAGLLSAHLQCAVNPHDVSIRPNPEETGGFFIDWQLQRYLLSPDGHVTPRAVPMND